MATVTTTMTSTADNNNTNNDNTNNNIISEKIHNNENNKDKGNHKTNNKHNKENDEKNGDHHDNNDFMIAAVIIAMFLMQLETCICKSARQQRNERDATSGVSQTQRIEKSIGSICNATVHNKVAKVFSRLTNQ